MAHAINWFEIPTTNFERAVTFYTTILGKPLHPIEGMPIPYSVFATEQGEIGGAISGTTDFKPSENGPLIYLTAGDDLNNALGKVEAAGGSILVPKTSLGEYGGFFAIIRDTEGNRIGLHSPN
jgi:predicted enzyme related to lactoylglutathione lyase